MKNDNESDIPPSRIYPELFFIDSDGNTVPTAPSAANAREDVLSGNAETSNAESLPAAADRDVLENDEPLDQEQELGTETAAGKTFNPLNNGPVARVMDDNFLRFASYTICSRAIPTVEDGLKPVQRRILHTLHEMDDGRFIKVATVVGRTMFYHPHGDASIKEALVTLENKRYLIEGQGNFGNIYTGDESAAARYIECRLTDLARNEIFNKKTTEFIPSYDGRNMEPVLLPSKLPLLLMLGAEGIAVGLSTKILTHNFIELLEAEINIINGKPFDILPDFQTGGLIDVSEYNDGNGRVKTRARMNAVSQNTIVITELPFGVTSDALINSIADAARRKKVPVKSIQDSTSDHVEIILTLSSGATPEKAIKALYAFTRCEDSVTASMVVIENNRPKETTVSEVLKTNVAQLTRLLKRELEIRKEELEDSRQKKTLIQIFIEERIYKRIEKCSSYEQIQQEIRIGFVPFRDRLFRDVTDDDIEMLLAVQIRRISLYDMEKNRNELDEIAAELDTVEKNLGAIKAYTVEYIKGLIKKYKYVEKEVPAEEAPPEKTPKGKSGTTAKKTASGRKKRQTQERILVEQFPRLTEVTTFNAIAVREITSSECSVCYDSETGFLGHSVKTGAEMFKCSSLDKIIVVWPDGKYRLIPVPEKLFVDRNMLYAAVYDRSKIYTAVYTEKEYPFTCLKRFAFGGIIMNRDYSLLPEKGEIILFAEGTPETIRIRYKPAKGQKIVQKVFNPEKEVAVKGVKARGKQITAKPILHISCAADAPKWWDEKAATDKGGLF